MTQCHICGAAGELWTHRAGRDLLRCRACGFLWVPQGVMRTRSGASIYEDEAGALFETQTDYYRDAGADEAAQAKLAWVRAFVRPGTRLLDVGANLGQFVAHARTLYDAVGIEPSPAAVREARARIGDALQVGSVYDDAPQFAGQFDAITLFDVIEHLPDPRAALDQCRRFLAPGGHLFLTTPDSGSMMARLLGTGWYYLDLEQHISIFREANLRRLLAECGFAVIARRTVGRRYRLGYIERRLGELGRGSALLRAAHLAARPVRWLPDAHLTINLRDVVGLVAQVSSPPAGGAQS